MRVGVFVIDDEKTMLGGPVQRNKPDIVVVVPELLGLGCGGLVVGIEVCCVGE